MKRKFQIGDDLDIYYFINLSVGDVNTKIKDKATITFIKDNLIYTCGHCFPKNALTNYGTLVYSSGFDSPTENDELAIIKIDDNKLNMFRRLNILNDYKHQNDNIKTILLNNRKEFQGLVIKKINKKLEKGWQKINNKYSINHQITKLNEPYYLVIVDNLVKNSGLSGSPWLVLQNDNIKLLGAHIGRTNGKDDKGNVIEISYVKELNTGLKKSI